MNKGLKKILVFLIIILLVVLAILLLTNCTSKKIKVLTQIDSVEVDNTNRHISIVITDDKDLILEDLIKETNKGSFKLYLNDEVIIDNKININEYNYESDIYKTTVTLGNETVTYTISFDLSRKVYLIEDDSILTILYLNDEGNIDSAYFVELLGNSPSLFYDLELTKEVNLNELIKGDKNKGLNLYYSSLSEVVKHTIKFESNGGEIIANQVVIDTELVIIPDQLSKLDYTFIGWFTDLELLSEYDFNTSVLNDFTLYAKWQINRYTVSFDSNEGTNVSDITVDANGSIDTPTAPTKYQHKFIGWYTDSNLEVEYVFGSSIVSNITLYAKWEIIEYTISFESNGGSLVEDQIIIENELVVVPKTPTMNHYKFIGWFSDEELLIDYDFKTNVLNNFTLYAKWQINRYTVSFDSNEGTTVSDITVEASGVIDEPTKPTKDNHRFLGWYTDSSLEDEYVFGSSIISNITLYAKWEVITYIVSFNTSGGSLIDDQIIVENGLAFKPEEPSKLHYIFNGWYLQSDIAFVFEFDFSTTITNDMTLIAKWEAVTYTVTFETNSDTNIAPLGVIYNNLVKLPNDPIKEHYTFDGWFIDELLNDSFIINTLISKDITLYAKWNINTYTISFVTNHETTIDSQTVKAFSNATEPTELTKEYFNLEGWYTEVQFQNHFSFNTPITEDLTLHAYWQGEIFIAKYLSEENGGVYVSEDSYYDSILDNIKITNTGYIFLNWSYKIGEDYFVWDFKNDRMPYYDLVLFATWKAISYTVSFVTNGSNEVIAKQITDYNSLINKVKVTKDNFILEGWYINSKFTGDKWSFDTDLVKKAITLYAKWVINELIVTINIDGDEEVYKILSGDKFDRPNDPTLDGYKFINWYLEDNYKTIYNFDELIVEDITIYARLDEYKYSIVFELNGGTVDGNSNNITLEFTDYDYDSSLDIMNLFSTPILGDGINKFSGWGYEGVVYTSLNYGFKPDEGGKISLQANYDGLYDYVKSSVANEYYVSGYKNTPEAKASGLLVFDALYYKGYPITGISNKAFNNTGDNIITNFFIGPNIIEIKANAFEGINFPNGKVYIPSNVTKIYGNAFLGANFSELEISSGSIGRSIFSNAFSGNLSLTKVSIGTGFINIGKGVFFGNTNIEELVLPYVGLEPTTEETNYVNGTFGFLFMDTNLVGDYPEEAVLPTNLKTIHIRNNAQVTTIGPNAFKKVSLVNTTLIIGEGVKTLIGSSFEDSKFKEVVLKDAIDLKHIRKNAFLQSKTEGAITIPDNVTQIGTEAFIGSFFSAVIFSENTQIHLIDTRAFSNMMNLDYVELYWPIDCELFDEEPLIKSVQSKLFEGSRYAKVKVNFKEDEKPECWNVDWAGTATVIYS